MRGFGINLLAWSGDLGPAELALFPIIRDLGYDCVELPIFAPNRVDLAATCTALRSAGLACTVSTALPAEMSLLDPTTAPATLDYLHQVISCAATLGAPLVCGPMALPVGALCGRGYTTMEWHAAVTNLRAAGDLATAANVSLALEPLNRFETYFINTVDDAVRLLDEAGHPALGLLLDTFHMHIEEKSTPAALVHAARHLHHFHASENDRGSVGSGQICWTAILQTLHRLDYQGWIVVESFNALIPALAGATCIWRPLAPNPEILARESITFLRGLTADTH